MKLSTGIAGILSFLIACTAFGTQKPINPLIGALKFKLHPGMNSVFVKANFTSTNAILIGDTCSGRIPSARIITPDGESHSLIKDAYETYNVASGKELPVRSVRIQFISKYDQSCAFHVYDGRENLPDPYGNTIPSELGPSYLSSGSSVVRCLGDLVKKEFIRRNRPVEDVLELDYGGADDNYRYIEIRMPIMETLKRQRTYNLLLFAAGTGSGWFIITKPFGVWQAETNNLNGIAAITLADGAKAVLAWFNVNSCFEYQGHVTDR